MNSADQMRGEPDVVTDNLPSTFTHEIEKEAPGLIQYILISTFQYPLLGMIF